MENGLWEHFAIVRDPRVERSKRHKMSEILSISVCAVICGAEYFTQMEEFGKANEAWFRTFLELEHGIPSHDTFGRVFAAMDPTEFEQGFQAWVHAVAGSSEGKHVAIDGKCLRRSFDRASGKSAVHLVSAWVHENHTCFGQVAVDEKSNEITAIPKLLKILSLRGSTVTIDAMGCQRKVARQIVEKEGDYVLSVKENQETLYEDIQLYLDDAIENGFRAEHDEWETVEKGHGRIESRRTWTTGDVSWLRKHHDWAGLSSIAAVERRRRIDGKESVERSYFISSLSGRCAQRIGSVVRDHWSVENSLHWMLDVCFREDDSRIRIQNAAENFSRLRRIALMLLKQEKSSNAGVKSKRLRAGWDRAYLLKVLKI